MLTSAVKRCAYNTKLWVLAQPIGCRFHVLNRMLHCRSVAKQTWLRVPKLIISQMFSTAQDGNRHCLPPLMDIPRKYYPPIVSFVFAPLISFVLINGIVDREFNLVNFCHTSKKAISIISQALAREDYETLDGLVPDETIRILKTNISKLTSNQKELIRADEQDIFAQTVSNINVQHNKVQDVVKDTVEIELLCYYTHGFNAQLLSGTSLIEILRRSSVCNYKFVRHYENHEGGSWVAATVNQFSFLNEKEFTKLTKS